MVQCRDCISIVSFRWLICPAVLCCACTNKNIDFSHWISLYFVWLKRFKPENENNFHCLSPTVAPMSVAAPTIVNDFLLFQLSTENIRYGFSLAVWRVLLKYYPTTNIQHDYVDLCNRESFLLDIAHQKRFFVGILLYTCGINICY